MYRGVLAVVFSLVEMEEEVLVEVEMLLRITRRGLSIVLVLRGGWQQRLEEEEEEEAQGEGRYLRQGRCLRCRRRIWEQHLHRCLLLNLRRYSSCMKSSQMKKRGVIMARMIIM